MTFDDFHNGTLCANLSAWAKDKGLAVERVDLNRCVRCSGTGRLNGKIDCSVCSGVGIDPNAEYRTVLLATDGARPAAFVSHGDSPPFQISVTIGAKTEHIEHCATEGVALLVLGHLLDHYLKGEVA